MDKGLTPQQSQKLAKQKEAYFREMFFEKDQKEKERKIKLFYELVDYVTKNGMDNLPQKYDEIVNIEIT